MKLSNVTGREPFATEGTLLLHQMVETSTVGIIDEMAPRSAVETKGLLLTKDVTACNGMGNVGPGGIALEADVAGGVLAEDQHGESERDWLRTLAKA